jgi:hypothetical protein
MDVVRTLRRLWRLRLLLAVGAALTIVVATLLTYRVGLGFPPTFQSRQYQVGLASTSVLLDTQSSQVADLGDPEVSAGPGILTSRAQLLANLLVSSPLKERVAAQAGVDAKRFITELSSSNPNQPIPAPAETAGVVVKRDDPDASVLNLTINDQVPIITFNAQAPSAARAARIADAAVSELGRQIQRTKSTDGVPRQRELVFEPLGRSSRSSTEMRGSTKFTALLIALVLFGFWCVAVLGIEAVARRWRQANEAEATNRPVETVPSDLAQPKHGAHGSSFPSDQAATLHTGAAGPPVDRIRVGPPTWAEGSRPTPTPGS